MNTPSDAVPESRLNSQVIAPAAMPATRPMYWSVRRELWENRSIYIAPLVFAAFVLFGFAISTIHLPHSMAAVLELDAAHQRAEISKPYNIAAGLILLTAFLVGVFYCLDALHGERRDRSILFWKSLPVSDLTTVLSKASIPLVIMPLLLFGIIVATQLIMLLLSSAVPDGVGLGRRDVVDTAQSRGVMAGAALRIDRDCTLARAALRMAAAGLRLGASHRFSLGLFTTACHMHVREGGVQHFAFRIPARISLDWLLYAGFCDAGAGQRPASAHTTHSRQIPDRAGAVDRLGIRRDLPRRRGPDAPLSWTNLMGTHPIESRVKDMKASVYST